MNSLDFKELMAILQNSGEDERIEAKKMKDKAGKSLLETISAFSNEPGLNGGYLVLGLTRNHDHNSLHYDIVGVADADKIQSEIVTLCRQNFNVRIRPDLSVIHHKGKNIIVAYIPEAESYEKPVYIQNKGIDKGAFRRIGPTDQMCTQEDLDYLYQGRSKKKYDETILEGTSFEDVDLSAIDSYRLMRKQVNKNAKELQYTNDDLLKSLSVLVPSKGGSSLTVAGLILFGNESSLRRELPMASRVDYIMIEGREWVPHPDRRYHHSIEIRESLFTGIYRLLQHIMTDIPQAFALDESQVFRKDNPLIPRNVIREALCNALMHRDYTVDSPMQIRRYSNRIEFENAGYSLKPEDQLGLPGSISRNTKIATILHDTNLAETKGTGIRAMHDSMQEANLTGPLIESKRASNQFSLTLLTHHLFDQKDIEWLGSFKDCNLSQEDARALIVVREMGAISNADFRTLNNIDTLTASNNLRRLRDLGLLKQKGSGSNTYYVPSDRLSAPDIREKAPDIREKAPDIREKAPDIREKTLEIEQKSVGEPKISGEFKEKLDKLGKREKSSQKIKTLIKEICSLGYKTPAQLGYILKRNPEYLRKRYLSPMVESGELELRYPNLLVHPMQAYKTVESKNE